MTMNFRNNAPKSRPAVKAKQPDRRKRRTKSKGERLTHAPGRSDRQAVATCRNYLLAAGNPITSNLPLAACWREILPLIPENRQEASILVIGILIAEGITPADVTTVLIEKLIETIKHRHRAAHLISHMASPAEHEVQRSLPNIFKQFVIGLIIARSRNSELELFEGLDLPRSRFEILAEQRKSITPTARAIIDGILGSDYAKKLEARPRERYRQLLLDCAAILERNGVLISAIADLWSEVSLDILCDHWRREATTVETCLISLYVLRWVIKNEGMDLPALDAIQSLTKQYRGQRPKSEAKLDLPTIARYGKTDAYCRLVAQLMAAAGGEGIEGQPRQQIAKASGACLCLIQLISGVRLPQLAQLAIAYDPIDQRPSIVPVIDDEKADQARTLPMVLKIDEVQAALEAFCDLFYEAYGRMPTSLLDGLLGERDHQGSAQARMSAILGEIAPGMTPGMLRDLLVWRLAKDHAPSRIATILGYQSLMKFEERYTPLLGLVSSQALMG